MHSTTVMSLQRRIEMTIWSSYSQRDCFGCVNKGQYSEDCHKRLTCKTCGNTHPVILHYSPKDTKEPSNQEELGEMKNCEEAETIPKQAVSNCSSVCHSIGERGSLTNLMFVSVWTYHKDSLQREIVVYALLDEATDTTFIRFKTPHDPGLTGNEVKLHLFIMLGKTEITVEKTTGLVVKRIGKRVEIALTKTQMIETPLALQKK